MSNIQTSEVTKTATFSQTGSYGSDKQNVDKNNKILGALTITIVNKTNTKENNVCFFIVPQGSPQNITPAATSATSVVLAWKPLTRDFANGLILGYKILLFDKLRNTTRKLTVQSLDQANIENLFPYTEYEARIVPFNSKGEGNSSSIIPIRTKEAGE